VAKSRTTTRPATRPARASQVADKPTARAGRNGQAALKTPACAEDVPAARWLVLTSFVLSLIGLAVSAYLTIEHYTTTALLSCPDTGAINCVKVTSSTYSKVAGIPVALLGLLFYVAMAVLCSPKVWRMSQRWLTTVRLAAAGLGVLFILYLIWAELFKIQAICLWCTSVHVVTVALFAVLLVGQALRSAAAVAAR
jgi:uncharacterized membrane protein